MTQTTTHSEKPAEQGSEAGANGSNRKLFVVILVLILCGLAGFAYWWQIRNLESTDDAYVSADIVRISPQVAGRVDAVHVSDNQHVQAGDPLVDIDPRDYQAALAQAQANLQAAKAQWVTAQAAVELTRKQNSASIQQAQAGVAAATAQARQASADAERYQSLYTKDEIAKQTLDQAQAQAKTLKARLSQARSVLAKAQTAPQQLAVKQALVKTRAAQVQQAEAAVQAAQLQLSYTHITAPRAGKVTKKNVLVGQQVAPGRPLMALVSDEVWVVANFKETQIRRMRIGQPVGIEVDAYPDKTFRGHIDSLQSGTGAVFSLLPPENATGNFVKVVQRVPVKIVFDDPPDTAHPLVPGMSVVPTVNVAAEPEQDVVGDKAGQPLE